MKGRALRRGGDDVRRDDGGFDEKVGC